MRNIARKQIKKLFNNPQQAMYNGLWFSGYMWDGEYKLWYENGQLAAHCFYKDGERDGEYKVWHEDGQLETHCFYKDNKLDGEYKMWHEDGKIYIHRLYKDDEVIKDYLR